MSNTRNPELNAPETPHNREAEEAVIGAIFINPDAYFDVAHFLEAEDFYIHRLRWAYEAIQRLQEKQIPLDLLTFGEEMNSHYADFGGPAFATSLINSVPTSLHAEHYAEIIKADSKRRKLLKAANGIATSAYNKGKEIEDVAGEAVQLVDNAVADDGRKVGEALNLVISRVYDQIDENSRCEEDEKNLGLKTGYTDLDKLLGGIGDTDFVLIGARPGQGKSTLLANFLRRMGIEGVPGQKKIRIALFGMEMSNDQTTRRLLGQMAEIDTQKLKAGELTDLERERFIASVEKMSVPNIYLYDSPMMTPLRIRSISSRLKMTSGLDLIMVDHIGLLGTWDAGRKFGTDTETVSYISRRLKMLAQEIHIPVVSAVQLNRDLEKRQDKHPQLSDLRSSGSLEQDANMVAFLYRPDQYEDNARKVGVTEVVVAKNRDGKKGNIDLMMKPAWTKFFDTKSRIVKFT